MVTVRYGVNAANSGDADGRTVGEVREQFEQAFNIPEGAQARVNGSPASDDTVLASGSTLEFVRISGEKGN